MPDGMAASPAAAASALRKSAVLTSDVLSPEAQANKAMGLRSEEGGWSSGNCGVAVALRVRPLTAQEEAAAAPIWTGITVEGRCASVCLEEATATSTPHKQGPRQDVKRFAFDHVQDDVAALRAGGTAASLQESVYDMVGGGVLDDGLAGFNVTLFAYGQTGSGKTYTLLGDGTHENRGLIPRVTSALFKRIEAGAMGPDPPPQRTTVDVSILEIYNEQVREHPRTGPYVEGLTRVGVESWSDMESIIELGMAGRTLGSTSVNDTSSRGHTVFTLHVTQWVRAEDAAVPAKAAATPAVATPAVVASPVTPSPPGRWVERASLIHLVDLAGSERQDRTQNTGRRLKESCAINTSLALLNEVIRTLARGGGFVPYRNSVLTWLLKESLGGNSKTVMVATVSPAVADVSETLSTLQYAARARRIRNRPTVNEDPRDATIKRMAAEIRALRSYVAALTARDGGGAAAALARLGVLPGPDGTVAVAASLFEPLGADEAGGVGGSRRGRVARGPASVRFSGVPLAPPSPTVPNGVSHLTASPVRQPASRGTIPRLDRSGSSAEFEMEEAFANMAAGVSPGDEDLTQGAGGVSHPGKGAEGAQAEGGGGAGTGRDSPESVAAAPDAGEGDAALGDLVPGPLDWACIFMDEMGATGRVSNDSLFGYIASMGLRYQSGEQAARGQELLTWAASVEEDAQARAEGGSGRGHSGLGFVGGRNGGARALAAAAGDLVPD